jgi:hypothetical protein
MVCWIMRLLAYVSPLHSSISVLVLEILVNEDLSLLFYILILLSLVLQVCNQVEDGVVAYEISPRFL